MLKRIGYSTCSLLIIAPVIWLCTRPAAPEVPAAPAELPSVIPSRVDPSPADTSRRHPRPNPPTPPRREPLDEAARAEGEALLRRMRTHWRQEFEALERAQAEGRYG